MLSLSEVSGTRHEPGSKVNDQGGRLCPRNSTKSSMNDESTSMPPAARPFCENQTQLLKGSSEGPVLPAYASETAEPDNRLIQKSVGIPKLRNVEARHCCNDCAVIIPGEFRPLVNRARCPRARIGSLAEEIEQGHAAILAPHMGRSVAITFPCLVSNVSRHTCAINYDKGKPGNSSGRLELSMCDNWYQLDIWFPEICIALRSTSHFCAVVGSDHQRRQLH